jgi:RNA polymerase sigma-70 factor, ECF subfamily
MTELGADAVIEARLETHRRELTGYCYRMLGSAFEAEDAAQETILRAWKSFASFEGRSSLRSWLFRIATNVCFDALNGREGRARPMDLSSPASPDARLVARPEATWIEPVPEARVLSGVTDPADLAVARDSIRLAFVAALQHLPPRQRAVLILREVLHWHAREVAELLDTTAVSVNSALQRARATLASVDLDDPAPPDDDERRALLERYVDAFERYDMDALVAVLHEDATMSMPPHELWLRGLDDVLAWMFGQGEACRGSRLIPVAASGAPAFAAYRASPNGGHEQFAIQVVDLGRDRVRGIHSFLDPRLFALFGMPSGLAD